MRDGVDIIVFARRGAAVRCFYEALRRVPGASVRVVDRGLSRVARLRTFAEEALLAMGRLANTGTSRRERYAFFTSPDQALLVRAIRRSSVAYYAVDDFTVGHDYWTRAQVDRWEGELIARSKKVFAVSRALGEKLEKRFHLTPGTVMVSPNAVSAAVIPHTVPGAPRPLATTVRLSRPVVGLLGSVSSRLRLDWIRHAVESLPELSWLFAGWVDDVELAPADLEHLSWLRAHPRCHFTGGISYEEILQHAASIDVALLAYSDRSVNPWGSPMRLFASLPFGHPIVTTGGCAQIEEFADCVSRCESAEELTAELARLHAAGFDDGKRALRVEKARAHTWEIRAARIVQTLRGGPF